MDTNNSYNFSKTYGGLKDTMLEVESKTQKIVTALYLVSDLIDEEDPLRKDVRNLAVSLSALVGSIAIESPSQAKKTITEAQNYIDRILNVLKVCVSVGFVSDMNFKVISEYLVFVRDDLNQKYGLINSQSLLASSFHNKGFMSLFSRNRLLKTNLLQSQFKKRRQKKTQFHLSKKTQSKRQMKSFKKTFKKDRNQTIKDLKKSFQLFKQRVRFLRGMSRLSFQN